MGKFTRNTNTGYKATGVFSSGNRMLNLNRTAVLNYKYFEYILLATTHTLPSAPNTDQAILYDGVNYGRPQFRLKPAPSSDTGEIYFEEKEEQLFLKFILQAFRMETNVIPLDFRSIKIGVDFKSESEGKNVRLSLKGKDLKMVYINQANILKDIHASLEIPQKYKADIYKAFTEHGIKIDIYVDIWWKKPTVPNTPPLLKWIEPTPSADQVLYKGSNIHVKVEARDENAISNVKLWVNGKFFRQENHPPYEWGASDQKDTILSDLPIGKYTLQAIATDKTNKTSAIIRTFNVIKRRGINVINVVKPIVTTPVVIKPQVTTGSGVVKPKPTNVESAGSHEVLKAQKVDVNANIFLKFDENDHYVFRGAFGDLVADEYKWERRDIPNPMPQPGEPNSFTIHYRKTKDPNFYFFLPQVFRLNANDGGLPDVSILMWKTTGDKISDYQIAVECNVLPYIHPNAKKDLLEKLYETEDKKYVDLGVGGYQPPSFTIDQGFKSIFESLGGKEIFVDGEKVESDEIKVAAAGFNIKFIASLESFNDLRRRFEEGFEVGKLEYQLEETTASGQNIISSNPIKVEVDLQKLANLIPQVIIQYKEEAIDPNDNDSPKIEIPTGVHLKNDYPYPISIKGLDLTLLSKVENEIYDVDYQILTERKDYPISIPNGNVTVDLDLDAGDIKKISEPGLFWTDLISAPYGVYFSEPVTNIMKKIIDQTSTDGVPWKLAVEYRFSWNDLVGVTIAIIDMEEQSSSLKTVRLTPDSMEQEIEMITSLNQYLDTASGLNRSYKYKVRYEYASGKVKEDSNWKTSSVFESDFLSVALAPEESSIS